MPPKKTESARELGEALGTFLMSIKDDDDVTQKKKCERVECYLDILNSMPDDELKYLSKTPEKLIFDLEAYAYGKGVWEKIKMVRDLQRET